MQNRGKADRLPIITPIRNFLVSVPHEAIAPKGWAADPNVTFSLLNPRNSTKATGSQDPDHPDQVCFVLTAPDGDDVVKIGDLLEVHLGNGQADGPMALQIRVGPDDIVAYSRILSQEELAGLLPRD